ncbi:hypothetical protein PHISP_06345 [Aspergillus sp. HF37]|nr:hypothetical protein PHISP_06345 [Aspergillus sp. HF37]
MGVLRLPRPTGIYVPNSPTRTLTTDMISPPLSAGFNMDAEAVTASIIPALDYISSKLQQRMMHVTLLIGRGKPYATGQGSELMVIPVAPVDTQLWKTLTRAIEKATRRFSLGQSWPDALSRSQHERHAHEYLIQQSIMQNEVVYSSEGLTLLNMDRIYTIKRRLSILSLSQRENAPESYIASCVDLLHRTIRDFQGRPFSKAFFHRVYEQLDVRDEPLALVAEAYKAKFAREGIVFPPRPRPAAKAGPGPGPAAPAARRSPIRAAAPRSRRSGQSGQGQGQSHAPPPSMQNTMAAKRGPKTPLSASDVTPVTKNEWNMLVRSELSQAKPLPAVTKWTPSPTVLAAA